MSRASSHELRALKRRILRAEAGRGAPDLASRRAFNAKLHTYRLALRAGGGEKTIQIIVEQLIKHLENDENNNIFKITQVPPEKNYFDEGVTTAQRPQNYLDEVGGYDIETPRLQLQVLDRAKKVWYNHENRTFRIFLEPFGVFTRVMFHELFKLRETLIHICPDLPKLQKYYHLGQLRNDFQLPEDELETRKRQINQFLKKLNKHMHNPEVCQTVLQHIRFKFESDTPVNIRFDHTPTNKAYLGKDDEYVSLNYDDTGSGPVMVRLTHNSRNTIHILLARDTINKIFKARKKKVVSFAPGTKSQGG